MEVYEIINRYLKKQQISKKEFAKRLINMGVKLKNTGETPSETTIYAYLNGRISIKIELIPYIAEILKIPEQLLFDDSHRSRKIYLKYILETILESEKQMLRSKVCSDRKQNNVLSQNRLEKIHNLLVYAPDIFLDKLEDTLQDYKELTFKLN